MPHQQFVTTEICVDSIDSVIQAHSAFVQTLIIERNATRNSPHRTLRFELCSALHQGGLTPSVGFVRVVIDTLSKTFQSSTSLASLYHIELFLMIRSRPGLDFEYSFNEVDVMLKDVEMFGNLFCERENSTKSMMMMINRNVFVRGVVFGALKREKVHQKTVNGDSKIGRATGIDHEALSEICSACEKFHWTVTFHRAIDYLGQDAKPLTLSETSSMYFSMLEELATKYKGKVQFVLTSGGVSHSASENNGAALEFLIEKLFSNTAAAAESTSIVNTKEADGANDDDADDGKNDESSDSKLKIIIGGGVNKQVIERVGQHFSVINQQETKRKGNDAFATLYGVHFSGKRLVTPVGVPESETYWALDQKLVEELFGVAMSSSFCPKEIGEKSAIN